MPSHETTPGADDTADTAADTQPKSHGDAHELASAHELYKKLFDDAKIGLLRTRFDDGLILACNDRAAQLLGYTNRRALGPSVSIKDLYVDPTARAGLLDRLRADRVVHGFESRFRRADGAEIWLRISVEWFEDKGWIEGVIEDVTDQKNAENALRESEERLSAIFETAQDYIFVKDTDLRYTHVNPAVEELFGKPAEEIIGRTDDALFSEDVLDRVVEIDRQVLAGRVVDQSRTSSVNGVEHVFHTIKVPLRDESGDVVGLCGIARDITELKRVELVERVMRAILQTAVSEVDLRTLISEIRDLLHQLIDTTNFFVAFYNEATGCYSFPFYVDEYDDLGRYEPEPLPQSLTDFVRRTGQPLFGDPEVFKELEEGGEVGLVGTDTRQWIGVPLTSDRGVIGVVVVQSYHDPNLYSKGDLDLLEYAAKTISIAVERKRSDESRRELEARVLRSQKMESLGTLAGGLAHEFNNRLQEILGSTGIAAQMLPSGSPIHQQLAAINSAADGAAELTRQMLAYAGKSRFIVEDVHLSRLVEDVLRYIPSAYEDTTEFRYELAEDVPLVTADASEIRLMISNLITNAVEALNGSHGRVTIRTRAEHCSEAVLSYSILGEDAAPGSYVIFEVADTGSGMDQDMAARIFDPFFSTKFAGRGLGLAAVLGIVRVNRGAIRVESAPGMGTSVRVFLPVGREPDGEPERESSGRVDTGTGQRRVMVVDDDEAIRSLTQEMLEQAGYAVVTAKDGVDAVEKLRSAPGDLDAVVLDMTMPRMSGEETFREMVAIRPDLPVIVATGFSQDDAIAKFHDPTPAGFLQKPFRLNELVETLERIRRA
jgi:PAS domain S-box-containing protein